jgi:hypothetical protein
MRHNRWLGRLAQGCRSAIPVAVEIQQIKRAKSRVHGSVEALQALHALLGRVSKKERLAVGRV